MAGDVTKINKDYLTAMRTEVQRLLGEVDTENTVRVSISPGASPYVPLLDENLKVLAGADAFYMAHNVGLKLTAEGGSVQDGFKWFRGVLQSLDAELAITISRFSDNESLNDDLVDDFLTWFASTVAHFNPPK
jgi:hypothetical protein